MSHLILLATSQSTNPLTPYDTNWILDSRDLRNSLQNNPRGGHVSLHSVSLPNVVYPINEQNNNFYFTEFGDSSYQFSLSPGVYNITELLTHLESLLNSVGTLLYTVSYNSVNSTIQLTVSTMGFKIDNGVLNIYKELGLPNNLSTTYSLSISGVSPINISGSQYVDIIMNFPTSNYSSGTTSSVLSRVGLTSGFGTVIYYEPSNEPKIMFRGLNLQNINMVLYNDKGLFWKLPANANVAITLKMEYL